MLFAMDNAECRIGKFSLSIEMCELEQGNVYSVVGPNGSGKSTFLNMLAFLNEPSTGEVRFKGVPVDYSADLVSVRREVAYLMQNPYLFSMKVEENVGYGLKARGVSQDDIEGRVKAIMERMSIAHLAGRSQSELSGGEAQRVALARTLVLETKILLLDEPTASVDVQNVRAVEKTVLELCRERNATLVLSTHSMEQAYRMSSNILSIVGGRIHGVAYENVFVGQVSEKTGGVFAVDVGVPIVVAEKPENEMATIAIESRDILISEAQLSSSALNSLQGTVTRVDVTDRGLRVFIAVGVDLCAIVTKKSFEQMGLSVGSDVWVSFKASSVKIL